MFCVGKVNQLKFIFENVHEHLIFILNIRAFLLDMPTKKWECNLHCHTSEAFFS